MSDTLSVALRLRHIRRQRAMSLAALEGKTGLTKSYLSKIERGLTTPSIATMIKLAKAFDVQVGHLFGETADDDAICVVRKHQRKRVIRRASGIGYQYEALAYTRRSKCMDAFIMRPPLNADEHALFEHEGEELIFVLSGRVEVMFSDRRVVLEAGDTVYFDAHLLHRSRSLGAKLAETLIVVGGLTGSRTGDDGIPSRARHGQERPRARARR
jgi:transcriptional regulator with XRE-family HTH domain